MLDTWDQKSLRVSERFFQKILLWEWCGLKHGQKPTFCSPCFSPCFEHCRSTTYVQLSPENKFILSTRANLTNKKNPTQKSLDSEEIDFFKWPRNWSKKVRFFHSWKNRTIFPNYPLFFLFRLVVFSIIIVGHLLFQISISRSLCTPLNSCIDFSFFFRAIWCKPAKFLIFLYLFPNYSPGRDFCERFFLK